MQRGYWVISFESNPVLMSPKNYFFTAVLTLLLSSISGRSFSQSSTSSTDTRPKAIPFQFSVNTTSQTSAGIYTPDSVLIRTLWSGVTYNAGTYTGSWDGTDDNGRLVSNGNYVVKVLSSNVNYTWEGVIGNNSDSMTGATVQVDFSPIYGIAMVGKKAYTCSDYAERQPAQAAFDTSNRHQKINLFSRNGTNQETRFVATDGTNVYWAGFDPFSSGWCKNFVFATKVTDNSYTSFSSGVSLQMVRGINYTSVIDYINDVNATPTGMAVQQTGRYLFVSHGNLNQLRVLDKTSGSLVQTISITNPKGLAIDKNDNLWVISDSNTVTKYTVNSNGTLTSIIKLSGLISPLALAVSPDNNTLVICDGGASQQLKAFKNNNGAALWTYGQKGGYMVSPNVTTDKFYFSDVSGGIKRSYIAFQQDGSFWVGDAGNYRSLHYAANRTYLNQIMYLPHFYNVSVDKNNPKRVFAEFLEFKIDYSKPLAGSNGSWTLVKNWRAALPADYFKSNGDIGTIRVLRSVVTLGNGRTYSLTYKVSTSKWALVELPSTGVIRLTGVELDYGVYDINAYGALNQYKKSSLGNQWLSSPLTGFDSKNNPVWGAASITAVTPADPNVWNANPPGEQTTSGLIIGFDNSHADFGKGNNFHIGGVKKGSSKWLWRTAKNTTVTYAGQYPDDGAYDIGNNVVYGGGSATIMGNNIFWNYHGEFWKNGQTNEFTHLSADGLMVGTFGTNSNEFVDVYAPAKMAGNTLAISSTKDSLGNIYILGCDESYHGGIQRWKVSNLSSIKEQVTPIQFTATNGLLGQYYDSTNLNNFKVKLVQVDNGVNLCGSCSNSPVSQFSNFSVKWTGFIKPDNSQPYTFYLPTTGGVRMWVDGKLIIDHFNNQTVAEFTGRDTLTAGVLYPVCIEYSNPALANIQLLWSSASTVKQLIPTTNLYSACMPDTTNGVDLMEGSLRNYILQNRMYGWVRNAVAEDYTSQYSEWWSAQTDLKTYGQTSPDVSLYFRQSNGITYTVTRDLGSPDGITSWKINGKVNFDRSYLNIKGSGAFLDVLDDAGKIISRFYIQRSAYGVYPVTCSAYGNTKALNINDMLTFQATTSNKNQPLEVSAVNGIITFKYAGFSGTDAVYDPSANWQRPKTLRLYFTTVTDNFDRRMGISEMRFLRNYATTDTTNKLSTSTTATAALKPLPKNSVPYISAQVASIKVYPNPVTTQQLNVRLENIQQGTYQVKVVSMSGQVVLNTTIQYGGNTSLQSFALNSLIAKGQYELQVIGNGTTYTQSFTKM